jgi:hypothetical protein
MNGYPDRQGLWRKAPTRPAILAQRRHQAGERIRDGIAHESHNRPRHPFPGNWGCRIVLVSMSERVYDA